MKKGISIDDLPPRIQEQVRKQLEDSSAVSSRKQKQNRSASLGQASGLPKLHAPCYLRVVCYKRGHSFDVDNFETKGIQDGIVKAGILPDDTVLEIPKIYKEGIEVKTAEEERTEIELIQL